jgi:hypothetical protein
MYIYIYIYVYITCSWASQSAARWQAERAVLNEMVSGATPRSAIASSSASTCSTCKPAKNLKIPIKSGGGGG